MPFIKLQCRYCENPSCTLARHYVHPNSAEGCSREVDEETEVLYYHLLKEKWPESFHSSYSLGYQNAIYAQIINLLDTKIFTAPAKKVLDNSRKKML